MAASEPISEQLARARRIRGDGPTTFDYLRWRDATDELLIDLLGPSHDAVAAFRTAVGPVHDKEAEGLQIHGQHGMLARLNRAEATLHSLL
jgi:hypothetical protein